MTPYEQWLTKHAEEVWGYHSDLIPGLVKSYTHPDNSYRAAFEAGRKVGQAEGFAEALNKLNA